MAQVALAIRTVDLSNPQPYGRAQPVDARFTTVLFYHLQSILCYMLSERDALVWRGEATRPDFSNLRTFELPQPHQVVQELP